MDIYTILACILGLSVGKISFHLIVFFYKKFKYRKTEGFDLHAYLDDKDEN